MPSKTCRNCLFGMQPQGEGVLVCVCSSSPHAGESRGGLQTCPKFVSYSQVITELGLKANQWREWTYDGVSYFVALDGRGSLVVFQLEEAQA